MGTRHPPSVAHSFPEARGLITWLKIIVSDITLETLLLHHKSSLLKHAAGIWTRSLAGGELPRTKITPALVHCCWPLDFCVPPYIVSGKRNTGLYLSYLDYFMGFSYSLYIKPLHCSYSSLRKPFQASNNFPDLILWPLFCYTPFLCGNSFGQQP